MAFTESDMHAFWQWAQRILAGDLLGWDTYHPYFEWMKAIAPLETWYRWWGGKEIFRQAPFYPYAVAGLLALSGKSVGFVIFAQLVVGALHPLVIFRLARRLFDERVGLIAAGLTAFYGPFIFHQGLLLRDWLPPLVEPLALLALLRAQARGERRDWLLGGAALGLALVIKETILLFFPLVLLWLVLEYRGAWRQVAGPAALLLLGIVAVMSPLFIRNAVVGAPLLAISTHAVDAIVGGNAADGSPVGLFHPASMAGILDRASASTVLLLRETLKTYQGDWLAFVRFQLLKLRAIADPLEVANNVSFTYGLEVSPVLRFTLRYGAIFPLGLAGFLLSLKSWRRHRLLAFYGLSVVTGLMALGIVARYRLTLVPVLIIYGAAALVWLFQAIRRRQTAHAFAGLGLLVAVSALQHFVFPARTLRDLPDVVVYRPEYIESAKVYGLEGRFDRAVREMERLRENSQRNPALAKFASETALFEGGFRVQWARQLLERGERDAARRQTELADAAYASYRNLSYPYNNLGLLYLRLNEPARAKAYFQRFLELEPEGPRADAVRRLLSLLESSP